MDKIRTWFFNKRLEWLKELGEQKNQTDFANYLGLPQSILSSYEAGRRKPGKSTCWTIYKRTNDETIYDVCGFTRPGEVIEVSVPVSRLPRRLRTNLDAALAEINAIYLERSIQADSPESVTIAKEVMAKHGFVWRDTE